MMYADKYLNHFLFIVAGRARFAAFARYVLNAIRRPGTPEVLLELADAFEVILVKFEKGLVQRVAGAGATQGNTATEEEQWTLIKAFINKNQIEVVNPAYHESAKDMLAIYPDKLGGLTQSKHDFRLSRFTAYTEALEARAERISEAPGVAARLLLLDYKEVYDIKQSDEKGVTDTIATLGPDAKALCWALWGIHTTALNFYKDTPELAAAFFDYDILPQHKYVPVADRPVPPPAVTGVPATPSAN